MADLAAIVAQASRGQLVAVTLAAEAEDGSETEVDVLLDAQIDRASGEMSWQPLRNLATGGLADAEDQASSHLSTKRWMWAMLNDHERNAKYEDAIRLAVQRARRKAGEDGAVRTLDIGMGSGLLSLMAARAGADSVVGCEMVPAMAEAAARIAGEDKSGGVVTVFAQRSSDLELEPVRPCTTASLLCCRHMLRALFHHPSH
jgi:SAM-dependent methyltransferase